MDLFKGQKVAIPCPNCQGTIRVDGGLLTKNNPTVKCPKCNQNVTLDTTEFRKQADKAVRDLKKMFK